MSETNMNAGGNKRSAIESYRESYLGVISRRALAIAEYTSDAETCVGKFEMGMQDEVARTHFLYYMDELLRSGDPQERAEYLTEAFSEADGSQQPINQQETGQPLIYELQELFGRITMILLDDDTKKVKQDLEDMYNRDIHEPVMRLLTNR